MLLFLIKLLTDYDVDLQSWPKGRSLGTIHSCTGWAHVHTRRTRRGKYNLHSVSKCSLIMFKLIIILTEMYPYCMPTIWASLEWIAMKCAVFSCLLYVFGPTDHITWYGNKSNLNLISKNGRGTERHLPKTDKSVLQPAGERR